MRIFWLCITTAFIGVGVERRIGDHRKPSSNPKGGNHPAFMLSLENSRDIQGVEGCGKGFSGTVRYLSDLSTKG
jgi:hypothetical protein